MRNLQLLATAAIALLALASSAAAHPEDPIDDGVVHAGQHGGTGGHLPPSSLNVQLVSKLRVTDAGPSRIADVAGFGNYAYTAWRNTEPCQPGRVNIIDLSNPAAPREVGIIPSHVGSFPGEGLHVIHVDTPSFTGDILAQNNETCSASGLGGVSLWDVTNPLSPQPLAQNFGDTKSDTGATVAVREYHSVFAWQQGGRAFVVASDDLEQGTNDVDIFEITDPRNPVMVAEVGLPDWPAAVVNGFGSRSFNHDMVVEKIGNTWTMLSSYWDAGYVKLNVNDPANPKFIDDSDFSSPDPEFPDFAVGEGNGHYAEFDRRGRFIIGTDEDFSPFRVEFDITTGPNAGRYESAEGAFTKPINTLPDQAMNDGTTYLGFGCIADRPGLPAAGEDGDANTEEIAVMQRGVCTFQEKADTAVLKGYDGFIVFNDAARGDAVLTMGGTSTPIPGIFVGHFTGQKIFGGTVPAVGTTGEQVRATSRFDGWGYIHLFDAGTLNEIDTYAVPETKLEANASGSGTMSVHEVTFSRNSDIAYLSWYDAGLRVVSFGPGGIKEVGHFIDIGGNDFWGVQLHKAPDGTELVLASDRDSGLYVFRYTGPR
jgi:hypothetical protein